MTLEYPQNPTEYYAQIQAQYERIYPLLVELYPQPRCGLNFENPFQLLVATVLSAQCTDERVNMVTPALFARFPNPAAMADAATDEMEQLLNSLGLYRNKARNLIAAAKILSEQYNGEVPDKLEELIKLPGAARKTANVVLGNAFGINTGIAVDTHVTRLVERLGLSKETTPEKIEQDLMRITPQADWTNVSHRLIWHGRLVCQARKPACVVCRLAAVCPGVQIPSVS